MVEVRHGQLHWISSCDLNCCSDYGDWCRFLRLPVIVFVGLIVVVLIQRWSRFTFWALCVSDFCLLLFVCVSFVFVVFVACDLCCLCFCCAVHIFGLPLYTISTALNFYLFLSNFPSSPWFFLLFHNYLIIYFINCVVVSMVPIIIYIHIYLLNICIYSIS